MNPFYLAALSLLAVSAVSFCVSLHYAARARALSAAPRTPPLRPHVHSWNWYYAKSYDVFPVHPDGSKIKNSLPVRATTEVSGTCVGCGDIAIRTLNGKFKLETDVLNEQLGSNS